jgi:hypothetical protein
MPPLQIFVLWTWQILGMQIGNFFVELPEMVLAARLGEREGGIAG